MQNSPQSDRIFFLKTVISGGQTGVDRAGLDAAIDAGVPTGGWCPRGRRAENGIIPADYPLKETSARSYAVRTEWNVRDSDGTLILVMDEVTAGTRLTVSFARKAQKPLHVVKMRPGNSRNLFADRNSRTDQIDSVVDWICEHRIRVLNVAGPRGSSDDDVYEEARSFFTDVLNRLAQVSES